MKRINNEIVVIALLFLISLAASNAGATTTTGNYDLHAALVDPLYYGGSGDHALVVDGQDFIFTGSDGSLIEYDDGTAVLSGFARQIDDATSGFNVNVLLQGWTLTAPADSPKKELFSSAYLDNGGPVDTGTWYYYASFAGTFEGVGQLAGTVLTITQRGPAFQVGVGANNKNLDFGASAWFWAEDAHGNRTSGDFNLAMTPVPVPAAIQLLISGLFVLGLTSRRHS